MSFHLCYFCYLLLLFLIAAIAWHSGSYYDTTQRRSEHMGHCMSFQTSNIKTTASTLPKRTSGHYIRVQAGERELCESL